MASVSVNLKIDMSLISSQVSDFAWLLQFVPKRRAEVLKRKLLTLLNDPSVYEISRQKRLPAGVARDLRVSPRILGLDELMATTFRAGKLRSDIHRLGHKSFPSVVSEGVGTPDSTFGGDITGGDR